MPDPLFWAGGDVVAGPSAVAVGPSLKVAAVAELMELMMDETRVGLGDGVGAGLGATLGASEF